MLLPSRVYIDVSNLRICPKDDVASKRIANDADK